VPELPGCASDGATPEAARENVRDAIVQWLDTAIRSVPVPRG
jgi:predicted RNase H-like HicB family nuclease